MHSREFFVLYQCRAEACLRRCTYGTTFFDTATVMVFQKNFCAIKSAGRRGHDPSLPVPHKKTEGKTAETVSPSAPVMSCSLGVEHAALHHHRSIDTYCILQITKSGCNLQKGQLIRQIIKFTTVLFYTISYELSIFYRIKLVYWL